MPVPILKVGDTLIASLQGSLSDRDLTQLREDLSARIGQMRARGVVIDLTVLDVIDSFATRTLRAVAQVARLRGARTVLVGIRPDVAMAMVQLGLTLDDVPTALDLEDGMALIGRTWGARDVTHISVPIRTEGDIVTARQAGRDLGAQSGLSSTDQTLLATAISEVARNIVEYAGEGEIVVTVTPRDERRGIVVVARDTGPGIAEPDLAMRDGFSTNGSLGRGLPGSKRLVDAFELDTAVGRGTTITMTKWVR